MATKEQQAARRQKRGLEVAHAAVERLRATGEPALPMPVLKGQVSDTERAEYRGRQRLHLERHPDYDGWWKRPSASTAEGVWQLLKDALDIQPSDLADADLTAKQALAVALECCVRAGEEKGPTRGRQKRRLIVQTHLLDVLALRWSDWFRQCYTEGRRTPQGLVVHTQYVRTWDSTRLRRVAATYSAMASILLCSGPS
jgi:hypothetical protein